MIGGKGRSLGRVLSLAVAILGLAIFVAPVAQAHSGEESYIYLEFFDDGIEGRVEFPVEDLNDILGLDIPQDEAGAVAATEASLEVIQRYAEEHLALSRDGDVWELEFEGFDVIPASTGTYSIVGFVVAEDFDEIPRVLDVRYDGVIEAKPEKSALLHIATDWGTGTFANESDHLLRYTDDNVQQTVDLDDQSFFRGFSAVVGLGVEHIFIGSDHILFIAALVLPAVLVFRRPEGWLPAPSFRSSLWRVIKIATSFTIAHTITLTLGGLGIIELSPPFVESVIAISIALAAFHNLRPVAFNREWIIAFVFGLFHGFGFAGLLADLGLTRSNRIVSLLGFNLGIELGQIAIIVLIVPALFLLRRTRYYVPFMRIGSVGLIVISLGWFIDRAFGAETGVDQIVVRLFVAPRPLVFVASMTVAGLAAYYWERRAGRLLPLPEEDPVTDERESVPVV